MTYFVTNGSSNVSYKMSLDEIQRADVSSWDLMPPLLSDIMSNVSAKKSLTHCLQNLLFPSEVIKEKKKVNEARINYMVDHL